MRSLSNSNSKNDLKYLVAVKTEYKLLEKKYISARDDLIKWNDRIQLAKQKDLLKLRTEAEKKAENIQSKIRYLTEELIKLKVEIERVMDTIQSIPQKLSPDPAELLSNLENLIGDGTSLKLEKEIEEIKADKELERIKRDMENRDSFKAAPDS